MANFGNFIKDYGGALGTAVNAGSSLLNFFSQRSANKQAARQAELNRKFQAQEAEKQRKFNQDMYNLNNAYNSPSATMSRYVAAGLNPDLMYGSPTSASSPASSSAMPSGAQSDVRAPYLNPDVMSSSLMAAQIRNIDADTGNKKWQGTILETEATFSEALKQNEIKIGDAQIELIKNQNRTEYYKQDALYESAKESASSANVLATSIDEIRAKIQNLNSQTIVNMLEAAFRNKAFDKQIDLIASQISSYNAQAFKSRTEATQMIRLFYLQSLGLQKDIEEKIARTFNLYADTNNKYFSSDLIQKQSAYYQSMGFFYDASTNKVKFEWKMDEKWSDLERRVRYQNDVLNATNRGMDVFKRALPWNFGYEATEGPRKSFDWLTGRR